MSSPDGAALLERCTDATPRHDWTRDEAAALLAAPFNDLIFAAQRVHRAHFDANEVQMSELLSIKTGGCAEDCGYCSQSAKFKTGLKASKLMAVEAVKEAAAAAKARGAQRFCMGAAWRSPKDRDMEALCDMVAEVKSLGLETCMTLGMLSWEHAAQLAEAGLDYYNHNIDTSPDYYPQVISTRTFEDRLQTLARVRETGMKICCGGIVGMGEQAEDRAGFLAALARLEPHPESVPINALVGVEGTPLAGAQPLPGIEFVRVIAVARLMMPASVVRLSAGREEMSDEMQALCLLAGANSVFIGDQLLTTPNPGEAHDRTLFDEIGIRPMSAV